MDAGVYRRCARDCLAMARRATDSKDRTLLISMAAKWHDLAERVDKFAQREHEPKRVPEHWLRPH
jgi:hypothetical protein